MPSALRLDVHPTKAVEGMPKYAMVAVVEAPRAELAWEDVGERLLNDDTAKCFVAYVGAPWLVPDDSPNGSDEYGTDAIRLQVNGQRVDLCPVE
jgi:hypothetical protein